MNIKKLGFFIKEGSQLSLFSSLSLALEGIATTFPSEIFEIYLAGKQEYAQRIAGQWRCPSGTHMIIHPVTWEALNEMRHEISCFYVGELGEHCFVQGMALLSPVPHTAYDYCLRLLNSDDLPAQQGRRITDDSFVALHHTLRKTCLASPDYPELLAVLEWCPYDQENIHVARKGEWMKAQENIQKSQTAFQRVFQVLARLFRQSSGYTPWRNKPQVVLGLSVPTFLLQEGASSAELLEQIKRALQLVPHYKKLVVVEKTHSK